MNTKTLILASLEKLKDLFYSELQDLKQQKRELLLFRKKLEKKKAEEIKNYIYNPKK